MVSKHLQRIKALEELAAEKEKLRRSHLPFVLYRPWSFSMDQHYLLYYPEGLFQKPEKQGPVDYAAVCNALSKFPGSTRLQISMGECSEWLFAFHHYSEHSQIYTAEQLGGFKEKELAEHPELSYLTTEAGAEDLQVMLKLPQSFTVKVKDFLEACKEA